MQTTSNYGYNMVESTDTANIPVQISPNFNKIDIDLKAVSDAAITSAVDTFASNTHALVRDDADRNALFFVAPADYVAGDVFTLDGVNMNVTDAAGNALESDAFRVNSVVFGIVYGTRLTLYVDKQIANLIAANVSYNNLISGLNADNVQAAIDELKSILPVIPSSYAANAITYNNASSGLVSNNVQAAIDELKSLIPTTPTYIVTGLSFNGVSLVQGGYYIKNGIVYFDITLYVTITRGSGDTMVSGLPQAASSNPAAPYEINTPFNNAAVSHRGSGYPTTIVAMNTITVGNTVHYIGSYQMS